MATATAQSHSPASPGARVLAEFRGSMEAYAPRMLRIQTKSGHLLPLVPNRVQRILNEKIEAQLAEVGYVRAMILKARQPGVSTWIAARVYRGTTLWRNRNALVLGDSDDRGQILSRIYERFHEHIPEPRLRPAQLASRRGQEMLFAHDSQISVATAGGRNPGRAMTRFYLHLSELAFWERQLETLVGVLQTVPNGMGEVYIESTANGIGDEFHERWTQASSGQSDWIAIFLPWFIHEEYALTLSPEREAEIRDTADDWERKALDVGIEWEGEHWKLTPGQLAWRRWKITNDFAGDVRAFRQEFPATAREAFLVSGNAYFDDEALVEAEAATRPPISRRNIVLAPPAVLLSSPTERGWLRIWEMPTDGGHYVIGADTATGKMSAARGVALSESDAERGGRDYCSADVVKVAEWVWNKEREEWVLEPCERQVAQVHGYIAPELFAEQIFGVGMLWSCRVDMAAKASREPALLGVERNHDSGQTVLRWLRDHHYPKLYWHRRVNVRTQKPTVELGWVTDGTSRMPMLDALAEGVRNATIEIPSADTVKEMFTFVRGDEGRPEAQEGTHDDRVISLAISRQMTRFHRHGAPRRDLPATETRNTPTGV
jgi:hypothetical protein